MRALPLRRVMNSRPVHALPGWAGARERHRGGCGGRRGRRRQRSRRASEQQVGGEHFGADPFATRAAMHPQWHRLGPGQGVQPITGLIGEELQQLAQLVAPGGHGPEQRQRLAPWHPVAAHAQQLGEEPGPLAPLALAQGLGIGGRGGGEGCGCMTISKGTDIPSVGGAILMRPTEFPEPVPADGRPRSASRTWEAGGGDPRSRRQRPSPRPAHR
jgi:hypothetical protein